jgi:hypothetical protein
MINDFIPVAEEVKVKESSPKKWVISRVCLVVTVELIVFVASIVLLVNAAETANQGMVTKCTPCDTGFNFTNNKCVGILSQNYSYAPYCKTTQSETSSTRYLSFLLSGILLLASCVISSMLLCGDNGDVFKN